MTKKLQKTLALLLSLTIAASVQCLPALAADVTVSEESETITNPDGTAALVAGTGDIIEIMDNDGNIKYTYYLVVENDINGDGNLSLVDISWLQRHLVYIQTLDDASALAADLNADGRISLVDLSRLQRKLLKID